LNFALGLVSVLTGSSYATIALSPEILNGFRRIKVPEGPYNLFYNILKNESHRVTNGALKQREMAFLRI